MNLKKPQLSGEADQLAIYKRGQVVELGFTENNCLEGDLNPGPPNFKSGDT